MRKNMRKERKAKAQVKNSKPTVLMCSGASGGHIFPALATAQALRARGFTCVFVLGGEKFADKVRAEGFHTHILPAAPWNVKNPLRKLYAVFMLVRAFGSALRFIQQVRPHTVCGTGGYATVATVLSAKLSGVPTLVHEQNVLPGRANRFLARYADVVCLTFEKSRQYLKTNKAKVLLTGNPLRTQVLDEVQKNTRRKQGVFSLLVTGGSQGARVLSDVMPEALALLSDTDKAQMHVVHQARPEDVAWVEKGYQRAGVEAEVQSFFDDLPRRIAEARVVIGRAGTSTILESAALGRACVLVPLENLADGHQVLNAQAAQEAGLALMVRQADFTPEAMAAQLHQWLQHAEPLQAMERAGKKFAILDAADRLALAVIDLMQSKDVMRHALEEEEA